GGLRVEQLLLELMRRLEAIGERDESLYASRKGMLSETKPRPRRDRGASPGLHSRMPQRQRKFVGPGHRRLQLAAGPGAGAPFEKVPIRTTRGGIPCERI